MATQSASPASQNPQNPVAELSKQSEGDKKGFIGDAANESAGQFKFESPEPLREDQVQNAVNFLSHPRVRGSPIIYRRSFLEKKGLTKEEIDEAFRRVPDPVSDVTKVEAAVANQATEPKPSSVLQPHSSVQAPLSAIGPVSGVPMVPSTAQSRFHWYHALTAVGLLAASGAGTAVLFKNVVVPRLKGWILKVVSEGKESDKEEEPNSRLAEEAGEAAKAAASAAAVVANASQELLSAKNEERKYFEAFMEALDVQVKEMKSMTDTIRKLERRREDTYQQDKMTEEHIQSTRNGPFSNSLANPQIMGMGQRGEKPPGIKPWEAAQQSQQRSIYGPQSQSSDGSLNPENQENYGPLFQPNGKAHDLSEAFWKGKTAKINEIEPEEEEIRQFSYRSGTNERLSQRRWVPPQPPTVAVPEAAAAIRRPKPSVSQQQSGDELSVVSSDDGEEKRALKASDSLVEAEASGSAAMDTYHGEIQEE
ncbi:peroxisomal membrane protein PEX14-like isoform X2 [Typha latifolia]|uniref:peroxisomal membrane protein PEX14-like isoform X2 n=1 Tax=Typha latifolia TaxID=4733 RepID=UPI003C304641